VVTIVASVGWLLGLGLAAALPLALGLGALLLLVGASAVGYLWRGVPAAKLLAVAVGCAVLGVLRAQAESADTGPGSVAAWAGRGRVEVQGRIDGEPAVLDRAVRLRVEVDHAGGPGGGGAAHGALLALAPPGNLRHGDRVALVGPVERPVDGEIVPWGVLYAREGVHATMRAAEARALGSAPLGPVDLARRALYDLKAVAGDALTRGLPAPASALARGLLLGGTSGMPPDLVESFRRSGMTHVVAVSGYNVALVVAALLPLAGAIGRGRGASVAAAAVVLFVVLVGAPASAVRAGLMGCVALLARHAGRPADPLAALAAAVFAMTLLDPDLIGDLGFRLSALATLALVTLYPWVRARLGGTDEAPPAPRGRAAAGAARDVLAATLAVELLTLPIVALELGRVALLSPLANLLALPAVPVAMATSLALLLAAPLPVALAAPIGWVAWAPLAWIIAVVELCASPPWAALPLGRLPDGLAWGYYAAALLVVLSLHARGYRHAAPSPAGLASSLVDRTPAPLAIGGAFLVATTAWVGALAAGPEALRVTFFEESGAAVIRTASGRALLVDPGPSGRALSSDLGRALPFWRSDLDAVLLTADRPDATDALPELLRRHRVGQLVAPVGQGGRWREAAAAAAAAAPFAPADRAATDLGGGAELRILAPSEGAIAAELVAGPTRLLLVGAAGREAQAELADALDDPVDVLWLGQAAALEPLLRERADPRLLVQHVRPFPRRAELPADDRLRVLRSDDHGSVELTLRADGYDIRARR
jgi:competence protein ComEC